MKKVLMVLVVLLCTVSLAAAAELKVGDKAAFNLKNSAGQAFTLASPLYAGKVIIVLYTVGENKDVIAQIEAAKLDPKTSEAVGILNLKDISVPNFVLKKAIASKEKESGKPILLDENYVLVNAWGLAKKAYNIVIIDKKGICRYIFRGQDIKVPAAEVNKLIAVTKEYQAK